VGVDLTYRPPAERPPKPGEFFERNPIINKYPC
jgi:hypothetical protein